MIHNSLFQECLDAVPAERKAEFDLSFAIADRIAEVLKQRGMSQKDLALKLGKRESEVSKWLSGRHNFTTNTIARISLALDATIIAVPSRRYAVPVETNLNVAEPNTYNVSAELDKTFGKKGSESRKRAEEKAWQEYDAQVLIDARKAAGMTQQTLADKLQTSKS